MFLSRRSTVRTLLLVAGALIAAVALVLVLVLKQRAVRAAELETAQTYVAAWSARNFTKMYELTDSRSRSIYDQNKFSSAIRSALSTSTASKLTASEPVRTNGGFLTTVTVKTRLFGDFKAPMKLMLDGSGKEAKITWRESMGFPGLRSGEKLSRTTTMPPRGTLLARDGTVLAKGSDRSSPLPNIAGAVRGEVGPPVAEDLPMLRALGVPSNATVGISGLERILNAELVGTPGGQLKAGSRVLREVEPKQAKSVRSSISLSVLKTAIEGQSNAPRGGGVVVINAHTGEVLAFQGSAWSNLQPPGSTMKIVTAAAALEYGAAKATTVYPRVSKLTTIAGKVENADQEVCGGTLVESFAHSCNTVFAPLGLKLGAKKLVTMAEKFGFNKSPGVPGARISAIPEEGLDVARAAFGQDKVTATPLQIAMVAAIVGNNGYAPKLSFTVHTAAAERTKILSQSTASALRRMMIAVIRNGTGGKAAVPGVQITGGKTGTAEIGTTQGIHCDVEPDSESCGNADGSKTDAWMAAFAQKSSKSPAMATGVMRIGDFRGGETAAPVARQVLLAALR